MNLDPNVGPFIADNDRVSMRNAVDALLDAPSLDVCTAFLDAYGIAVVGQAAETGTVRLLVGYNLSEFPTDADIITFEMAREWEVTQQDPVERLRTDDETRAALKALELDSFHVERTTLRTHSKAYINQEIGIVGSSNLTRSGLNGQRELNLLQYKPEAVARLREWFEALWDAAEKDARSDFKEELKKWLEKARLRRFSPFEVYAKSLFERYRSRFATLTRTVEDVDLAIFQEEGRDTALGILAEHNCCIIADAVGLGKTFMAIAVMRRRAQAKKKNERTILVICPAQLESVWQQAAQSTNTHIITESMETIGNTQSEAAEQRLRDLAQYNLLIVDECHNFRNDATNRFGSLMQIIQDGKRREKDILLLTATPINNSISDLYSLYRLMTRDDDAYFRKTNLAIASLRQFFKGIEKGQVKATELLLETMVCRSRQDIRSRQEKGEEITINGKPVRFPDRQLVTLNYKLAKQGDSLRYDDLAHTIEGLALGAYNIENYVQNPKEDNRHSFESLQVLFKILMLKRLESSVISFISTAEKLLKFSEAVVSFLKQGRKLTSDEYRNLQLDFARELEEDDDTESLTSTKMFSNLVEREATEYDIARLEADVKADRKALQPLIDQAQSATGKNDGKIERLKQALVELLPKQKVLLFTFYSDTAKYIYQQLITDKDFMQKVSNCNIEVITGGVNGKVKERIVKRFAPLSNDSSEDTLGQIQMLISTDVLSEGQNLQDCGYLINYDLHFNPVRMVQRNGRIDRLFSPHETVTVANFFPEGELDAQLGIVARLNKKLTTIRSHLPMDSSVIGEEVTLYSLDQLRRTKASDSSVIDDIDDQNPINDFRSTLEKAIKIVIQFGAAEIAKIPYGCQSNRKYTRPGVFICVAAGQASDPSRRCWWLLYLDGAEEPITDVATILDYIETDGVEGDEPKPEVIPREICWDMVLNAYSFCREQLIETAREERIGQAWQSNHINKKLQQYFTGRTGLLDEELTSALGYHSLEKDKKHIEQLLKDARQSDDPKPLLDYLNANLQKRQQVTVNPETVPLQVVGYLELVPESEIPVE